MKKNHNPSRLPFGYGHRQTIEIKTKDGETVHLETKNIDGTITAKATKPQKEEK